MSVTKWVDCRNCLHSYDVRAGKSVKCRKDDGTEWSEEGMPWDLVTAFPCTSFEAKPVAKQEFSR